MVGVQLAGISPLGPLLAQDVELLGGQDLAPLFFIDNIATYFLR
jgi:hypothetical protein